MKKRKLGKKTRYKKTNESLLSLRFSIHLNPKNLNLFNFTLYEKQTYL